MREGTDAIAVRPVTAEDWRAWRELRLAALRDAPEAFSSKLAEWQGAGDTEARWRSRLSSVPFNVIADLDKRPGGMVSATAPAADGTIDLISMWVAPFARGRGAGDALVCAVAAWALARGATAIALDVVATNAPALALYRRHGFVDAGAIDCSGSGIAAERRMTRALQTLSR